MQCSAIARAGPGTSVARGGLPTEANSPRCWYPDMPPFAAGRQAGIHQSPLRWSTARVMPPGHPRPQPIASARTYRCALRHKESHPRRGAPWNVASSAYKTSRASTPL
jgi:hypothetical protein